MLALSYMEKVGSQNLPKKCFRNTFEDPLMICLDFRQILYLNCFRLNDIVCNILFIWFLHVFLNRFYVDYVE